MTEHGFLEITTPILTASSPEGARDYLVPARKHPGKFYALPQAPQQFKQLLMTSGFDRYFQIAPCFRDEDARADRSPGEFYQLDMEMAFAAQEDVFAVLEDVLPPIFAKYGTYNVASTAPFRRIPYPEAMEKYGSDKPDLRIDLTVQDVTDLLAGCGFGPFRGQRRSRPWWSPTSHAHPEAHRQALRRRGGAGSGGKPYWFRLDENGELVGGIAKFVTARQGAGGGRPGPEARLLWWPLCRRGKLPAAQKTAGVLREDPGRRRARATWTRSGTSSAGSWTSPCTRSARNPASWSSATTPSPCPAGGLEVLLKAERGEIDPLTITADQYDLVCNGVELSSGAVRNHDPEIMVKAFELVRLGEEDVKAEVPRHVQRLLPTARRPTRASPPAWTGWSCCWPGRTPSGRSSPSP